MDREKMIHAVYEYAYYKYSSACRLGTEEESKIIGKIGQETVDAFREGKITLEEALAAINDADKDM